MPDAGRLPLLLVALGITACPDPPRLAAPVPQPVPVALEAPALIPAWRRHEDYTGAKACEECHEEQFREWQDSPHGRALTEPSEETVRGRFDGRPVVLPDGAAVPVRDASGWALVLEGPWGRQRWPVHRVLASGRTHQLYVTQTPDSRWRLLPVYWASLPERWASLRQYRPAALDPASPSWWGHGDLAHYGCLDCHASQAHYRVTDRGIETAWVDGPVNCEACHGPGRDHDERRRRDKEDPDDPYPDLHALGKREDVNVCGQCHGYKHPYRFDLGRAVVPDVAPFTLAARGFRADGTQGDTVYQYAGHAVSTCYVEGAMGCSSCHDPHHQRARDLAGQPAEGRHSDRQCTVCHRKYIDRGAARAHSFHTDEVRCVDCHMAYSWMLDDPTSFQRTSDHSVSTPHPQETVDLGLPNACNATDCHADQTAAWSLEALRKWGQETALVTRPWVRTVAEAQKRAPDAVQRLLELVVDSSLGDYRRASALALLARQAPAAAAVPVLEELARHPAPTLRARALSALLVHDPERLGHWLRTGSADAHAFVRLAVFDATREEALLDDALVRRSFEDRVRHTIRPAVVAPFLVRAASLYLRRGDRVRGRPYLDLARRWTTPEQADRLSLDQLGWLYGPARAGRR